MEFIFFGEQGIPLIGGFTMFWGVSIETGYCQSIVSIPEEAIIGMEQMICMIELYPLDIDELSAKEGDGQNIFWSTLVADPSTYGGWYNFCEEVDGLGDEDLSFWTKKTRGIIGNDGGEK